MTKENHCYNCLLSHIDVSYKYLTALFFSLRTQSSSKISHRFISISIYTPTQLILSLILNLPRNSPKRPTTTRKLYLQEPSFFSPRNDNKMEVVDRAEEEEASSRVNFPLNSQSYNLLTELSSGPQAVVYKAECLPLSSELVAIKAIDFDGRSAQSLIDLIWGAEALTSFLHPNVVSTHCSFIGEDDRYWVVMPFLPAGSLLSVMYDSESGYSEAVVGVVLREVLKGLVYLHEQGKFHGDIKPGNILLGPNRSLRLADYGVSESCYDPDSGRFRPSLSSTAGNDVSYWVAPEKEYSPKWDIWTVGIVAMEMSYGRPPLSQLPGTESLLLQLRKRFGSWKDENLAIGNLGSFSEEYKDMVSLCLDQDPAKRPSAEDLLKHPFFLKYDTMEPTVIEKHRVDEDKESTSTGGTKEESDNEEGKNYNGEEKNDNEEVENDDQEEANRGCSRFITSWQFNRETVLMDPEFQTLSRTDSLDQRIEDSNPNTVIAGMEGQITGEAVTSSEEHEQMTMAASQCPKPRTEEEMAQEIKALKVALENKKKKNSKLEASLEILKNRIQFMV
ncbi:LOW QUALITY PROTEIN: Serine/threonine protein kinase [Trema orientale]|uniref:Serine/threonine protein kinase n=1 Tax=Trema orientale TaxID=63057 RepID=A0A2P5FLM4_TREOI|nr:LOW QUALITY PROTEIN: Serine/threonine protein kinase [Trema orientale]